MSGLSGEELGGSSRARAPRAASPFVGRLDELRWLERCVDAAGHGSPVLALIVGDAGIGKTRLLRELQVIARRRGADVAWGRGYEGVATPLLSLGEALEALIARAPDDVRDRHHDDIRVLRRALRNRESGDAMSSRATIGEPDLRLSLALSRILFALAAERLVVLIIDDMHWVDQASLDLLSHLVFAMADVPSDRSVRVLLLGSTRPARAEDRRGRAIDRLTRESICRTLQLGGLTEAEAGQLLQSLLAKTPSHRLLAAVERTTGGNPLFVEEIARQLGRSDKRASASGDASTQDPEPRLPEDVVTAIQGRVSEASEVCRVVLSTAAFLREPLVPDTLAAVTGHADAAVAAALQEAVARRLLVAEDDGHRFAHPIVRQALYGELSASVRARMHATIARTLFAEEERGRHYDTLELARHLLAASSSFDPQRVARVAERAGDLSFANGAWEDAARCYEAALAVPASVVSEATRAELHYKAGQARFRNQDAQACIDHHAAAVRHFESLNDLRGLARAHAGQARAQFTLVSVGYGTLIDPAPLESVVSALADVEPSLAAYVLSELAQIYWTARRPAQAEERARRALDIGKALGDPAVCAEAWRALSLARSQVMDAPGAVESLEHALASAKQCQDVWLVSHVTQRLPLALTWVGRLSDAERHADDAAEHTRRVHDWGDHSLAQGAMTCVATVRGDFEGAERHAKQAMLMLQRSGYPWAGPAALPGLARARWLRGAYDEADDALALLGTPGVVFAEPGPALQIGIFILRCLVEARMAGGDRAAIERLRGKVSGLAATPTEDDVLDVYALGVFCGMVELGAIVGHPGLVEAAAPALARAVEHDVVLSSGWVSLVPRVLGAAAVSSCDWAAAERWLDLAIARADAIGAGSELGLSHLEHARMLVTRDGAAQRRPIAETLARAVTIFDALDMTPFRNDAAVLGARCGVVLPPARGAVEPAALTRREVQVLELRAGGKTDAQIARELLLTPGTVARIAIRTADPVRSAERSVPASTTAAAVPSGQGGAIRVILFTDIVGSTELLEALGDAEARRVVRAHDRIVREALRRYGGKEIKQTGDGFFAWFGGATSALQCAISIQRSLAKRNERMPDCRVDVRIGLNAGEPVAERGDLFGSAVTAAERICRRAPSGGILVSDVVRHLATGKGVDFVDRGRVTLKGFTRRFRLYQVRGIGAST